MRPAFILELGGVVDAENDRHVAQVDRSRSEPRTACIAAQILARRPPPVQNGIAKPCGKPETPGRGGLAAPELAFRPVIVGRRRSCLSRAWRAR